MPCPWSSCATCRSFFVPAGVGLVIQVTRIRTEWEAIAGALVASTALTLVVTAAVFRLFARRQARGAR